MNNTTNEQPNTTASAPDELITITHVAYALQAVGVGLLIFPTLVVALILNYIKRDDTRGTLLESHFRWQIRTFWFGLLWTAVGWLMWVVLIGYVVHAVVWVWMVYRVIKGWLDLRDRKEMYRVEVAR